MKVRITGVERGNGVTYYAEVKDLIFWRRVTCRDFYGDKQQLCGHSKSDVEERLAKWLMDRSPKITYRTAYEDWELIHMKKEKERVEQQRKIEEQKLWDASRAAARGLTVNHRTGCTSGCPKPCLSC